MGMYGICDEEPHYKKRVHKLDLCTAFKHRTSKVKPRRLCDFCERGKRMNSEEGEHDLRLVKLTPLPAINLTSGETEEKAEPPFYAMFLYEPGETGEAATFPVKFCPMCGRKLVGD
jgi:hypothetical protein